MKNNFFIFNLIFYLIFCFTFAVNANEMFNFNVSEIEITDNGNKIKGIKRGKISTNEALTIEADTFEFDKARNLLVADGNIKINDKEQDIIILADKISYNKNKEIITGEGNIKINEKEQDIIILADKISYNKNKEIITGEGNINYINNSIEIEASKFKYIKDKKIVIAEENVLAKDNLKDLIIFSDRITYFKTQEKILTEGITKATIHSKYEFISKNVSYKKQQKELSSNYKTKIIQNSKELLKFEKFKFDIEKELLKAENIFFNDNIENLKGLSNSLFFKDAFFDLKNKEFIAGKTEIQLEKGSFNNFDNDPRLKGAS